MENKQNGYVCFYGDKRIEIYADSLYAAKLQAIKQFGVKKNKEHMVHCHLAEKNGEQVTHVADF